MITIIINSNFLSFNKSMKSPVMIQIDGENIEYMNEIYDDEMMYMWNRMNKK